MTDPAERIAEAHVFWKAVSSGDYTEWERHVRRDQHRLDERRIKQLEDELLKAEVELARLRVELRQRRTA